MQTFLRKNPCQKFGQKKVSSFWSSVGFKSSAVMHFIFLICQHVGNRGLTNWANVHIPTCEKVVENTAWQKSNQSSNFGCNWTSFHGKKKKIKNADSLV